MEDLSYFTRNHEFMKAVDLNAEKVKRKEFKVQLRKNNRIGIFERKRGKINPDKFFALIELPEILGTNEKLTNLEKVLYCRDLLNAKSIYTYEILKYIRKNLDLLKEDFISLLVSTDFISVLGKFLEFNEVEEILRETTAILCGITSGPHEYIKLMIEYDLVYKLFLLISNESLDVANNAIWCLSNIMYDCKDYWNFIVDNKFISNLVIFSQKFLKVSGIYKKCLLNALKSLALYAEDLFFDDFTTIFTILKKVNKTGFDWKSFEVLANLVKEPAGVSLFVEYKFLSFLSEYIENESECGLAALKVLANLNMEQESVPRVLIDQGLFEKLLKNLESNNVNFMKTTLWAIDCLLISSQYFMYSLINNRILSKVIQHLLSPNEKIRLESSYILINTLELSNQSVFEVFFQLGTTSILLQGLIFPDPVYLKNLLTALQILSKHSGPEILMQDPFIDQIFKLEFHINTEIKNLASLIVSDRLHC